jgi:hypothetical protein
MPKMREVIGDIPEDAEGAWEDAEDVESTHKTFLRMRKVLGKMPKMWNLPITLRSGHRRGTGRFQEGSRFQSLIGASLT